MSDIILILIAVGFLSGTIFFLYQEYKTKKQLIDYYKRYDQKIYEMGKNMEYHIQEISNSLKK